MGTKGITFVFNETSPNWMPDVKACEYFVNFYTNSKNKDLATFGGSITIREFFEGLAGHRPYLLPSLADKFGWEVGDEIKVRIRPRRSPKGNTALEITTVGAKWLTDKMFESPVLTEVKIGWDIGEEREIEVRDMRRETFEPPVLKWHYPSNAEIKKVIYNDPATIVFWDDGTKTVVKCKPGETFSEAAGLALCYMKKHEGSQFRFHKQLKKWLPKEDKK